LIPHRGSADLVRPFAAPSFFCSGLEAGIRGRTVSFTGKHHGVQENPVARLYIRASCAKKTSMNLGNPILLGIVGVSAIIVGGWVGRHFFSAEARRERRRRRSNARVSSTAKRPMVKFSVKTKKERRK
jgi:hypothetical protein